MTDLKTQLVRLGAHLDDTVPAVDEDELARRIAVLENAAYRPRRRPRPVVIALAAAAAALVLIGAVPLILDLLRSDDAAPAAEVPPVPTAAPTVPPPTAAPTTAPPATAAPTTAPEAPLPFDYADTGEAAGALETDVGNLEFFALRRVPYQWIEDGFPGPGGSKPDQAFRTVWGNAHSGLEIFETDGGFLGLGSTAGPDVPRIMTGYLGSFFRVRGVGTQAEFEAAFHSDVAAPEGFAYEHWGEDSGTWCCTTSDEDWFHFVPAEAWFSDDGIDWEQTAAEPFGPETVMLSQPRSVAEHDGTWMVLGWTGVGDPADLVGSSRARPPGWPLLRDTTFGQPAMWTSTDVKTWTQVPFDFGAPGWDTTLESVVASEAGWLVAGKRESHETPRAYHSLVWFSRDGVDWVELPMEELVGLPHCGPFERPETCLNGFGPEFIPGGIGIYAGHRTATGSWGWTLWVGLWED